MTADPWCTAKVHGGQVRDYRRGCKCTAARAAMADYERVRYHGLPRMIDSTGTGRRLRALAAAGWSARDLEPYLLVTNRVIRQWRCQPMITARNAAKVADVYDRLGLDEGPTVRSRRHAARMGWPPPIEWGANIDNPKAKPLNVDGPVGYRGRTMPLEDIELLALSGETWDQTAARLGSQRKVIDKRLRRAGRLDILERLGRNSEAGAMMALRESGAWGRRSA